MPHCRLLLVLLLSLLGCAAPQQTAFTEQRIESQLYPYAVYYGSKGRGDLVGPDWVLSNYKQGPSGLIAKQGLEYEVRRTYDFDQDGKADLRRKEPLYDLLLEHRQRDAELWIRNVPVAGGDLHKELEVIAERYIEAASTAGVIVVPFGAEGTRPTVVEKRFASRALGSRDCQVSGKDAFVVDFEIANVDQLQLSESSRWLRARLVVIRTSYVLRIDLGSGRVVHVPTFMLAGMSASPSDFAAVVPDFELLLSRTALGGGNRPIPDHGEHTCQLDSVATSGAEAPPAEPSAATPPADVCARVRCAAGSHCVSTGEPGAELAECIVDSAEATEGPAAAASCAVTLCAPNTYCDDASGQAQCLPLPACGDAVCAAGQRCELVQVTCKRAPCPPRPACLPASP